MPDIASGDPPAAPITTHQKAPWHSHLQKWGGALFTVLSIIGVLYSSFQFYNKIENLQKDSKNVNDLIAKEQNLRKKYFLDKFIYRKNTDDPHNDSTLYYDVLHDDLLYTKSPVHR